ncbi:hypothetical protein [uncultured archaeal virus]|uniref:Uncharacterized protein n=1 Tax=uncultured archaeal virus TaxID=1960247 RepID=A0A8B0LSC2_9VIRU|nr:hypothetical protein [uncultured archaeal virus]
MASVADAVSVVGNEAEKKYIKVLYSKNNSEEAQVYSVDMLVEVWDYFVKNQRIKNNNVECWAWTKNSRKKYGFGLYPVKFEGAFKNEIFY